MQPVGDALSARTQRRRCYRCWSLARLVSAVSDNADACIEANRARVRGHPRDTTHVAGCGSSGRARVGCVSGFGGPRRTGGNDAALPSWCMLLARTNGWLVDVAATAVAVCIGLSAPGPRCADYPLPVRDSLLLIRVWSRRETVGGADMGCRGKLSNYFEPVVCGTFRLWWRRVYLPSARRTR